MRGKKESWRVFTWFVRSSGARNSDEGGGSVITEKKIPVEECGYFGGKIPSRGGGVEHEAAQGARELTIYLF